MATSAWGGDFGPSMPPCLQCAFPRSSMSPLMGLLLGIHGLPRWLIREERRVLPMVQASAFMQILLNIQPVTGLEIGG